MDGLFQDLRYALRTMSKSPAFTAVVVATLALGVGANTAIFTLMDQVLLRPLPVEAPGRLVVLHGPGPYSGWSSNYLDSVTPVSHPMFEQLRAGNDVFESMLARYPATLHLGVDRETEEVSGALVSGSYFDTLGLRPALGRLLTPGDDRTPGGHPVVVLGHGFWARRFGADPAVLGRSVGINGHPMEVVGVAPAGFHGIDVGASVDVFLTLSMQPQAIPTWPQVLGNWRARWLTPVARLRPGVTREQAQAGVNVLYRQLLAEDLAHIEAPRARFEAEFLSKPLELKAGARGVSGLRDQSQTPLLVLMGMVGLVLLIACANVANLLLARASSRHREVAVRLALGAGRRRLVRQFLVESLVFSVAGGVLGIVVAVWTASLLLQGLPFEGATRTLSAEPDLRVGLFAMGLALTTGVGFGLVPALQATRPALAATLKNEATSVLGGAAPFRFRKGLVVAQVALSLLLLIGAGLFSRSLMNLRALDPGFEPESLTAFSLDPSLSGYDLPQRLSLLQRVRDAVAAEPGVRAVSAAEVPLLADSNWRSTVNVEGYLAQEGEDLNPNLNGIAPGFFETLGIPLLRGRDFDAGDVLGAPRVAIVNEVFARYFFGDEDPIGRRFGFGRREDPTEITIVGLVRDGKAVSLREEPRRFVYLPYAQGTETGGVTYYVRSALPPATLAQRLRELVQGVDAGVPVTDLRTMESQIGESLFVDRMVAMLSAAFGLLATGLAALGLYGVMSYAVSQRTREIGIRVALGAERRNVLRLVLREVALLSVAGVALGLPSGYGLGRVIESQLFGLTAFDPLTFGVATATLLGVALLAGAIPAARATRVDPMVALRYE